MGHEASGVVYTVGTEVTHIQPGDQVAIEPGALCRCCDRCKEGLYNLCPAMKFAACPPDTPGTLTKFFKIPADFCYKLSPRISLEEGVLAEPLAVAVHSVRMINVKPGQSIVVFGSGTIGLLCGAVAKLFGASKVIAVDILESKLKFAKTFNGCATYQPMLDQSAEENAAQVIDENQLGLGADGVIEASGAEMSINTAIHVLRSGGSFVQTGLGKATINFPIEKMSMKELHLHGAFRYGPGDYRIALEILDKNQIPVKQMISRVFQFEKTTDAWEATRQGEGIKNLIQIVDT